MRPDGELGRLLGSPGVRPALIATSLGRLSLGALPLSQLLLVQQSSGSFAVAGAASAGFALMSGVGAPARARWLDAAVGLHRFAMLTAGYLTALSVLLIVAENGRSPATLVVAAGVAGALLPPLGPAMRAVWAAATAPEQLRLAFAVDSVVERLLFLVGPVLAAMVAAAEPAAALGGCLALSAVGTGWFLALRPRLSSQAQGGDAHRRLGRAARAGVATTLTAVLSLGITVGLLQVALPAIAAARETPAIGGMLLGALSLGAAAGGLLFGRRRRAQPVVIVLTSSLAATALVLAPSPLLVLAPLALGLVLLAAGATSAPVPTSGYLALEHLFGPARRLEGASWLTVTNNSGTAIGAALAGTLTTRSLAGPLIAAAVAAATGAACVHLRQGSLSGIKV